MLFFFLCIQEDEEGYNDGDVDDDEDEEEPGMMAVIYFFLEIFIYIYIYICINFLKSRLMFSFLLLWPLASRVELTELIQHLSHLWKLSFH